MIGVTLILIGVTHDQREKGFIFSNFLMQIIYIYIYKNLILISFAKSNTIVILWVWRNNNYEVCKDKTSK